MHRLADWETRLGAYRTAAAATPFSWGRHDCLLAMAGAVQAMTGVDLAGGHRGKYRTAAGAARHLAKMGYEDIAGLLTDRLGPPRPLARLLRGDICMFQGAAGLMMPHGGQFVGRAADDADVVQTEFARHITGLGWIEVPRLLLDPMGWHIAFRGGHG